MQWGGTKWGKRRLNRDSLNENGAPFRLVLSPPLITHSPQLFDLIQQQKAATATTSTAAHQEVFSCIFEIPSTYSWQMLMFIRIKSLYTADQAESSRIKAWGSKILAVSK